MGNTNDVIEIDGRFGIAKLDRANPIPHEFSFDGIDWYGFLVPGGRAQGNMRLLDVRPESVDGVPVDLRFVSNDPIAKYWRFARVLPENRSPTEEEIVEERRCDPEIAEELEKYLSVEGMLSLGQKDMDGLRRLVADMIEWRKVVNDE